MSFPTAFVCHILKYFVTATHYTRPHALDVLVVGVGVYYALGDLGALGALVVGVAVGDHSLADRVLAHSIGALILGACAHALGALVVLFAGLRALRRRHRDSAAALR